MASRRPGDVAEAGSLQAYLRAIARFPILSLEDEAHLGRRIREHHDEDALRRLVESNLRFVVSYAKRYRGLGVPFLDLIHEGNIGLIEAGKRFDPARGVKFITYAVWWIRQALVHALSSQSRAFSLPSRLSAAAGRIGRDVEALTTQLERSPTTEEIAADMDLSAADVDALLQIGGRDVSLSDTLSSAEGDDRGLELSERLEQVTVPAAEDELMRSTMAEHLRLALDELDGKEREVMELRYGLSDGEPHTLQQIGERLHLSRERIRQIESRAKEKLRRSQKGQDLRHYLN